MNAPCERAVLRRNEPASDFERLDVGIAVVGSLGVEFRPLDLPARRFRKFVDEFDFARILVL